MLQNIRDNAQGWIAWVIVILISIPFALWGVQEYLNPTAKIIVAEVEGSELLRRDFDRDFRRQMQMMRSRLGNSVDLSMFEKTMKERVLNSMVEEELLTQTAVKNGMRISDMQLAMEIQSIPSFQENGKFSHERYQRALQIQGMSATGFEFMVRRAALVDQFQQNIIQSEILTPQEYVMLEKLQKQQRLVSTLTIPQARFQDVEISDAEVEAYFNDNKQNYFTEEKVAVAYVELAADSLKIEAEEIDEAQLQQRYDEQREHFTTPPTWKASHILIKTDKDPEAARKKAEDILARAKAGEDFAELAKEFSEDIISAKKGGDLGSFGPGRMVKPFEEALAALQPNDISELVESQFGLHIIKLHEKTEEVVKSFDEVHDGLLAQIKKEQAERRFYDSVDQFANLAFEHPDSLDILAETMGLEKQESELFSRSSAPDALSHSKIISAAFSTPVVKEAMNSEVIELDDQHVMVLRLTNHEEPQQRPLEEVKDDIVETLRAQKQKEAAEKLGQDILSALKENPDRQAVAAAHDLTWSDAEWLTRNGSKQPNISRQVFRLGQPADNQVIFTGLNRDSDYVVAVLLAIKQGEVKDQTPPAQQMTALGESSFSAVVEALKQRSDVKLYPEHLD
jgi:peptidyl-prolyl cis-trans isomerase D